MYKWLSWLWELPVLIALNLMLSLISLRDYVRVIWRYYGNRTFRRADLALLRTYLWHNPYTIHKQFLQQRAEADVYRYGETLLTTMEELAHRVQLTAADHYLELGCGRGRTCLWVHAFIGCSVVGIDYVPAFIDHANAVVTDQQLPNIQFLCRDFLTEIWQQASVVYIDATLLEGLEIAQLLRRCEELPLQARVIAVNLTLTGDYAAAEATWIEEQRFTASYPWGCAEVAIFRHEALSSSL